MDDIYIVWPEKRLVPSDQITMWFADAVANREIAPEYLGAQSTEEMADALSDAGIITRGRQ